jgi:hypothetical protein
MSEASRSTWRADLCEESTDTNVCRQRNYSAFQAVVAEVRECEKRQERLSETRIRTVTRLPRQDSKPP